MATKKDEFGRAINYLRVSVTDRCNLRCFYCMPPSGIPNKLNCEDILDYEEIVNIIKEATNFGVSKIRFTGGEPLVRKDFPKLVTAVKEIPGIDDLSITTNGILLDTYAPILKEAGLNRVNISLDTLNEKKFNEITCGGDLKKVFSGISKAIDVGLTPVKLNVVVIKGMNEKEILDFAKFSREDGIEVRFIEYMPMGSSEGWKEKFISVKDILTACKGLGEMEPVERTVGGGPAKYYRYRDGKGKLGFISAISEHFCDDCNRLRLTSDGKLKLCLFSDHEIDLKPVLNDAQGLNYAFMRAIHGKPQGHLLNKESYGDNDELINCLQRNMSQIGG